jgi:hypothetical protein
MSLKDYLKQQLAPTIRLFFVTVNIFAFIGAAHLVSWVMKKTLALRFVIVREVIIETILLAAVLISGLKFLNSLTRLRGNDDEH